jgi:hypothetical protein
VRVSILAVGSWALVELLASSGISKLGLKVLISLSKSKSVYSFSNSASLVRLKPFKASSTILNLVLEVGRLAVVDRVVKIAGSNLTVVTVVVGVVVDLGKALSISTGKAKNSRSIKILGKSFEFECLGLLMLKKESQVL